MKLKSSLGLALLCCGLAGGGSCIFAQSQGPTKQASPASTPYSTEESGAVTSALALSESRLRSKLAQEPDSSDLLYALALVLRSENKPRESLDIYTRAAQHRKPTPGELRSVALDYVLLKDYEDAIHWLEIAAEMDPTDINVLYSLGRCYYSKDRYLDAQGMYERILAIQPTHVKAEENLGLIYDMTNHPDKAEDALRKAAGWANENGTDEWPFLDFGSFLLDKDRAKEAITPLRIATHIRPESAMCHEKLGRALLAAHDSVNGVSELEQAARLNPGDPKIHFELGRALRQAGQADRAEQEFSLSRKLYSEHSEE